MEPVTQPRAGLVDLLDRVLGRGLVINADILICLAGVPLIGLNLRAALAGMDTMEKYGLMREWDRSVRAEALAVEPGPRLGEPSSGERLAAPVPRLASD